MEYRTLGRSGLKVSVLTMGTMTFGGAGGFAKAGNTDLAGARRQIDLCLDTGVNLIDTADVYSRGLAEEIVGEALGAKRNDVLVASKVRFRMGDGPNDEGLSRHHVLAPSKPRCAGCAPTTSTSSTCTNGTARPRSRRPSPPSTASSPRARSAMSAPPTTRPGT